MKLIVTGLLVLIATLLFIACQGATAEPPEGEVAVCLQGEPFLADGVLPLEGTEMSDAHQVSDLGWEAHEGCERFFIDFTAEDGSPAGSVGEVRAEVLRDLGVVRVTLRDVEWVAPDAIDESFEGQLARAAYSVWSNEGRWVYVDLHLADEAEAHVTAIQEPGRVLVDLRPGGGPLPPPAVTSERVVVLEPRPGDETYPLTVTGYARTFEANVVARIEQEGEEIHETNTMATAWSDAWGHYSFTFEDGASGPITLHIGEYSAQDGTWEGAVVELNMQ